MNIKIDIPARGRWTRLKWGGSVKIEWDIAKATLLVEFGITIATAHLLVTGPIITFSIKLFGFTVWTFTYNLLSLLAEADGSEAKRTLTMSDTRPYRRRTASEPGEMCV